MKRTVFIIVLLVLLSLVTSCEEFTTPQGRYNPIDEYYEPAGDPDNQQPVITFDNTAQIITSGAQITISVAAEDPEGVPLTFEWLVDNVLQSGTTDDSFLFFATPSVETTYTITVRISDGAFTLEREVSITVQTEVNNPPTVNLTPESDTIGNGAPLTLMASTSDDEGDVLSYSWYVDDTEQTGETGASFVFSATPDTEKVYEIKVTVSDGISSVEDTASITVVGLNDNQPPSVSLSPASDTIANGAQITLTAEASDPDEDSLSYTWFVNDQEQSGQTEDSFIFSDTPEDETTYAIKVAVYDGTNTAVERSSAITVAGADANQPPSVSLSPASTTISNGVELTLTTTATDPEEDSLSYKWFVGTEEQVGQTGSTFIFSAEPESETSYTIKVEVTDGTSTVDDTASVTVQAPENSAPSISIDETDQNLANGESFTFNTTYSDDDGDSLTFQWYTGTDGTELVDGATASTFTFSAAPASDTNYIIKVIVDDGSVTAEDTVNVTVYAPGEPVPPSTLYNDGGSWFSLPTPAVGTIDLTWGENTLYNLNSDGALFYFDSAWMEMGFSTPANPAALTVYDDSLWVYTSDDTLYYRNGASWQAHLSTVPAGGISLAASSETLYLLTVDNLYALDGGSWNTIGSPADSLSLTVINETLFVLRNDYSIYRLDGAWQDSAITAPDESFVLSSYDGGMAVLKNN